MPISAEEKVNFLQKLPIFKGLDLSLVESLAERARLVSLDAGKHIYTQGGEANGFILVYSGKVKLWRQERGREIVAATLLDGHETGQDELFFNRPYRYTATTLTPTKILWINLQDFKWLIKVFPKAIRRLRVLAKARHMASRQTYSWQEEDEVVRFAAQRHPVVLLKKISLPAAVIAIAVLMWFLLDSILGLGQISFYVAGMILSLGSFWFIWQWYDWQNDRFIITSLRVVWLEEVLLFGTSRQETLLSNIQVVEAHSGLLGNLLGYGDLSLRTFTSAGNMLLVKVDQPDLFKDVVYAEQQRVEQHSEEQLSQAMRQTVRQNLGLAPPPPTSHPEGTVRPTLDLPRFSTWNPFVNRIVDGDQIIYRKHWIVLLKKTFLSMIGLAGLLLLDVLILSARRTGNAGFIVPSLNFILLFNFIAGGLLLFLFWYRYSDYRNDLYVITSEMIVDSERKPMLGSLDTRTAPIKNIQSTKVNRKGILRNLLNYGTLHINVADQRLDFIDVYDPDRVMRDLFAKLYQNEQAEKEQRTRNELGRMGEMIRIYHDLQQDDNDHRPDDFFQDGKPT
jgi:CRP-like cAMP-binding protein